MGAKKTESLFSQIQVIRQQLSKRLVDFLGESKNQRENYVIEYIAEHEATAENDLEVLQSDQLTVGKNWVRYFPQDVESKAARVLEKRRTVAGFFHRDRFGIEG